MANPTRRSLNVRLHLSDVNASVTVDPLIHLHLANPTEASGEVWRLALGGWATNPPLLDALARSPLAPAPLAIALSRRKHESLRDLRSIMTGMEARAPIVKVRGAMRPSDE